MKGEWPLDADRVTVTVTTLADSSKKVMDAALTASNGVWSLPSRTLDWTGGMYRGVLRAWKGKEQCGEDRFMVYVTPATLQNAHPRVWFDKEKRGNIAGKLSGERFRGVGDDIRSRAESTRKNLPLDG